MLCLALIAQMSNGRNCLNKSSKPLGEPDLISLTTNMLQDIFIKMQHGGWKQISYSNISLWIRGNRTCLTYWEPTRLRIFNCSQPHKGWLQLIP